MRFGLLMANGGLQGADNSGTVVVMPDIVLSTLNAKYIHSSFGLRYLMANLGPMRERATIVEFQIKQAPLEIVEAVLKMTLLERKTPVATDFPHRS